MQRQPLLASSTCVVLSLSASISSWTDLSSFLSLPTAPECQIKSAHVACCRVVLQLRVYTAEDVSNELERAKVEYLESSVRVAGRKQRAAVVVPKLLHWHMRDFADDAASLLEWVHSQLPRASGPLRRAIREVLGANVSSGSRADTPAPAAKMVEVEPYDADFCYLLPVW